MIQELYSMKDDVAGHFSIFDVCVNKGTAERSFKIYCEKIGKMASDVSLYKCATFDTETGEISALKPEFILRGTFDEV